MTKAQEVHDAVTRLMDEGIEKAEAFRRVAAETGLKYDSVRGSFYTARRATGQGSGTRSRSRKRETTTQDAVASAVASLRGAIDSIELELETARERADEATAEYEAMRSASSGRIEEIRAKIAVLDPEASDEPPIASEPDAQPPTKTEGKPDSPAARKPKEVKGS